MSMFLTRSPLEPIGMNGAGVPQRRSARLSQEGVEENEAPAKKDRINGAQTSTVSTKEQDGDGAPGPSKKKRKYENEIDGFAFSKSKRSKGSKAPVVRNSTAERVSPVKAPQQPQQPPQRPQEPYPTPVEDIEPKTGRKKGLRRFPTTPEREAIERPVRRSKRLSNESEQASPHKAAHAKSHANHNRSPSPFRPRPVTVEKKRQQVAEGVEEKKTSLIQLPFQDTPVNNRNKQMRKASAENGHRRSSSSMRGKRASSLIDEGRGNGESVAFSSSEALLLPELAPLDVKASLPGTAPSLDGSRMEKARPVSGLSTPPPTESSNQPPATPRNHEETTADEIGAYIALPHSEVPTAEFFKHISADLTEPRRMRCLLGWCGMRALPPKPEPPKDNSPASNLEFQALQAARVIQEELSQDLVSKGSLSDWFSRDESAPPQIPLRKKPNPRNVANAAKAEELERELERLKKERAEWDELLASAASTAASAANQNSEPEGSLSPIHPELLDSPQRAILEQLQAPHADQAMPVEPSAIQQRLRNISENLEFTVDQFAHGIHALSTTKETADRVAERTLADAAKVLEEREKQRRVNGKAVDPMDALRGLAKVLNSQNR